jgi:hypothetical protein
MTTHSTADRAPARGERRSRAETSRARTERHLLVTVRRAERIDRNTAYELAEPPAERHGPGNRP